MTLDLILLGLIFLLAVFGALSGAARQIAQNVALVVAFFLARPLGKFLAPQAATAFAGSLLFGTIIATVGVFLVVLILGRYLLTSTLRRLFAGGDPNDRSVDRGLGFFLAGLKAVAITYVMVSALTFVEQNVQIAGKKLGFSPKDSYAFSLGRRFNLFEYLQFGGAKDLVAVAKASRDPNRDRKLDRDPAFKSVLDDPRFRKVLEDPELQRAAQSGDFRALLQSNAVLQLIRDPDMVNKLSAAAAAAASLQRDKAPPASTGPNAPPAASR